jgi:hypothetical protein
MYPPRTGLLAPFPRLRDWVPALMNLGPDRASACGARPTRMFRSVPSPAADREEHTTIWSSAGFRLGGTGKAPGTPSQGSVAQTLAAHHAPVVSSTLGGGVPTAAAMASSVFLSLAKNSPTRRTACNMVSLRVFSNPEASPFGHFLQVS